MREGREKRGRREGREERKEETGGREREGEGGRGSNGTPDSLHCTCAALTSRGSGQCVVRWWLWSTAVPPLLTSHNTRVSETVHSNGME